MRQSHRHRPSRFSNRGEQFSCPSSNKFHRPAWPFSTLRFCRSCFSSRQRQRPLTHVFAQETHEPLCSFVSRFGNKANPLVETREVLQSQMPIIAPGSQGEKQKSFKVRLRGAGTRPDSPQARFTKLCYFSEYGNMLFGAKTHRRQFKGNFKERLDAGQNHAN